MIMTNGIGATVGTLCAQAVIDHYVLTQPAGMAQAAGWSHSWLIFAAYALVVAVLFLLIFKDKKQAVGKAEISKAEDTIVDAI